MASTSRGRKRVIVMVEEVPSLTTEEVDARRADKEKRAAPGHLEPMPFTFRWPKSRP